MDPLNFMEKMDLSVPKPAEDARTLLPVIFTGTSPKISTSSSSMWTMRNTMATTEMDVSSVKKSTATTRWPYKSNTKTRCR